MASNGPGFGGIAARALSALVLVFATYNPEQWSFYHWAIAPLNGGPATAGPTSLKFLVGVLLLAAWGVFLNATRRSIGVVGAVLVLAVAGGVVWLLLDTGLVSASSSRGITYVVLLCTAALLGVGMSWSHLQRRMSGQIDTDESA